MIDSGDAQVAPNHSPAIAALVGVIKRRRRDILDVFRTSENQLCEGHGFDHARSPTMELGLRLRGKLLDPE